MCLCLLSLFLFLHTAEPRLAAAQGWSFLDFPSFFFLSA